MRTASNTAPAPETMPLAEVLREMDLAFVAAGDHSMTVEEAVKFIDHPHFVLLDVRTPQERTRLAFPFALHIPLQRTAGPPFGIAGG